MKVTKALILTAGYATRRLPITKAISKLMLPIGDRPIIDYVVQDCIDAGIKDIYIALNDQGDQVKAYFGRNVNLEKYLKEKGKTEALKLATTLPNANIHYFSYDQWSERPLGTAMPVIGFMQLFDIADDEQVVIVGADDFIYKPEGGSAVGQLIESTEAAGATAGMLCIEVPKDQTSLYGIIEQKNGDFVRIVEKPKPEDAPSSLANISKYLFDKTMLDQVKVAMKNVDPVLGEALLTDALNYYVAEGNTIHVVAAKGEYLDGGSTEGWLHANNRVLGRGE
jgi:UTP--glucose-1-phosphate uridylyltransferase